MQILIIEDEPLVAQSLIGTVKKLRPHAQIWGPIGTVKDGIAHLVSHGNPDLILADIQLADGISLDIFSTSQVQTPVIFTTAYNEFALRAFKLNSIDYLLKPIDPIELENAFVKFENLQGTSSLWLQEGLQSLIAHFAQPAPYKERFLVHSGKSQILVKAEDAFGFSKEELIFLHHRDGQKYLTDFRSLDELASLIHPAHFFRVNRQFILHLNAMQGFKTDEYGKLLLQLAPALPKDITVSKEKASEFKKWFQG